MILAYIYCGRAKEDNYGNLYFSDEFSQEIWDRYEQHIDHIIVCMRKEKTIYSHEKAIDRFYPFDCSNKEFVEIPDLSSVSKAISIRPKSVRKRVIETVVKKADALIVRLPSDEGNLAIKCAKK